MAIRLCARHYNRWCREQSFLQRFRFYPIRWELRRRTNVFIHWDIVDRVTVHHLWWNRFRFLLAVHCSKRVPLPEQLQSYRKRGQIALQSPRRRRGAWGHENGHFRPVDSSQCMKRVLSAVVICFVLFGGVRAAEEQVVNLIFRTPKSSFPPINPSFRPVEPSFFPVEPTFPPVNPQFRPVEPSFRSFEPSFPPINQIFPPLESLPEPSFPPINSKFPPIQQTLRPLNPKLPPVQPTFRPVEPQFPPSKPSFRPVTPTFRTLNVIIQD